LVLFFIDFSLAGSYPDKQFHFDCPMKTFRQLLDDLAKETLSNKELTAMNKKIRKETLAKLKKIIGVEATLDVQTHCDMLTDDWTREYPASQEFCASTGSKTVLVQSIDGRLRILGLPC
jgi:hypothetical protein